MEELLRDAGLRVTQARITVLNALEQLDDHPTADEVFAAIPDRGVTVSRATVFNVLDDLAAAELVMRADAGPGAARYEIATTFHHHFVCRSCGMVVDVPCVDSSPLCVDPGLVDGQVDNAQIIFRGTCARCLAADR